FQVAYSIGLLVMGRFIDKYGSRLGYSVSIAIWSLFGMLHACITKSMDLQKLRQYRPLVFPE
ncbi:MAG TPA: hypothetical protein VIK07_07050, partial [Bacteroidales bacterium]